MLFNMQVTTIITFSCFNSRKCFLIVSYKLSASISNFADFYQKSLWCKYSSTAAAKFERLSRETADSVAVDMVIPINIDNNDSPFSKIGATISIATLYVGMTVNAINDDATAAAIRSHCACVI
jgi:hypothetical protein